MKKITINKQTVINKDITHLKEYYLYQAGNDLRNFDLPAGETEFKLYAYMSEQINNKIILDIGTRHGGSAIALSNNPKNHVISYDIVSWDSHVHLKKDNITLKICDFMQDIEIDYSKVDLIMIDVDPHDGLQEPIMINHLISLGWEGIILLDDISETLWPEINKMWNSLPYEKYDLTDIGHMSGTGLVNIGNKFKITIIES